MVGKFRRLPHGFEPQIALCVLDTGLPAAIPDPEYLYQAHVLDVLDGDTLDLDIDLGFGVARKLRVRFAVIDCPPLSTKAGREARDFVASQLMTAGTVVVKTEKTDIYGRYIAHVFFTSRKTTTSNCFARGDYLNDLLVGKKLADVVG